MVKPASKQDPDILPDDVAELKAIIANQAMVLNAMQEKIARLEHNVEVFQRLAFGASSEKRKPTAELPDIEGQGHLFYAELVEEAQRAAKLNAERGTIEQLSVGREPPKKKGGRRKKFPAHVPVVRTTYELLENDRQCECGSGLHEIGEDVTKELERVEFTVVHEIARKKYGCRACSMMVRSAKGPDRVIDKGILGKGFLAHVITERFQNHMPYYRLEKKYASEGLDLSRSVLQRSMARIGGLLEPIHRQLRKDILESPVIHTDDTKVVIAQGSEGKSRQGHTWIYLDLDGNHYYEFSEDRSGDHPAKVLGDYKGFVAADAFAGYNQLFGPGGATEVACWAHSRRRFIDAESTDPDHAKHATDEIRKLYRIEAQAKGLSPGERQQLREDHAKPVLTALKAWLELTAAEVLPKSPMARAITYALNQWDALNVYLTDGRVGIDNNPAERAMRPFAVGRKNWLFYQTDTGGKTACIIASLLQTALANGINPRTYFRDVLTRIAHCSDVTKLTPRGWKEHFAMEAKERADAALAQIIDSL